MKFDCLRILAVSLLCMSTTGVQAQAPVKSASSQLPEDYPEKILFVGNSFTYFNDGLHMHYGNLLRAANLYEEGRNELRMMTYSGSGLWEHAAALGSAVTNDRWDAVVMHDYSNGPLTQWQRFVASSDKLGEIARGQGARPLLLRANRCGSGPVHSNADDQRLGLLPAGSLNPQKARVLLLLASIARLDHAGLAALFSASA